VGCSDGVEHQLAGAGLILFASEKEAKRLGTSSKDFSPRRRKEREEEFFLFNAGKSQVHAIRREGLSFRGAWEAFQCEGQVWAMIGPSIRRRGIIPLGDWLMGKLSPSIRPSGIFHGHGGRKAGWSAALLVYKTVSDIQCRNGRGLVPFDDGQGGRAQYCAAIYMHGIFQKRM
jgi:hypothetical protein